MPVQRVCRPNHTFRGFQGQIEAGEVHVGDTLTVLPGNETASVKSILVAGKEADTAQTGQPVTIQLDKEIDVSRGCVLEMAAASRRRRNLRQRFSGWMTITCQPEAITLSNSEPN